MLRVLFTALEKLDCISSAPAQPSLRLAELALLALLAMAVDYQRMPRFIGQHLEHASGVEKKEG